MSSRSSPLYASASPACESSYTPSASTSTSTSSSSSSSSESNRYGDTSSTYPQTRKAWVDPKSLANYGDASQIQGNVSHYVKQLILNTFIAYGAGDEHCFGHSVAKAVKFVDVSAHGSREKQGRMEATTIAEIIVSKSMSYCGSMFRDNSQCRLGMLNGAGMLHGGCLAFLIDK